jgi:hypothetical protein
MRALSTVPDGQVLGVALLHRHQGGWSPAWPKGHIYRAAHAWRSLHRAALQVIAGTPNLYLLPVDRLDSDRGSASRMVEFASLSLISGASERPQCSRLTKCSHIFDHILLDRD